MGMGSSSSAAPQNAAVTYAPAQIAVQAEQSAALRRAAATKPVTYNYDPNKAAQLADTFGRYSALHNLNSLHDTNPAAYEGYQSAVRTISGGTPGDDAFLQNSALKAGLERTAGTGITVNGPGSVGGASVANIFGRDILNYRQQRAGQQLQLAEGLTPDASVSPGTQVSGVMGNGARAADTQNQWQQYLNSLSLANVQNQQNNLQQNMSASQAAFNAQAAADAQANGAQKGVLGNLLGAVGTVGGGVVGGIYGGPGGAALGSSLGGLAGKGAGTLISH